MTPTKESAEQAIRRVGVGWYSAVGRAYESLDSKELQNIGSPYCKGCQGQIQSIAYWVSHRQRVVDGRFSVKLHRVYAFSPSDGKVTISVTYSGSRVLNDRNVVTRRIAAVTAEEEINVAKQGEAWVVTGIYDLK